jgi:probable HAF family extracellular repeat protein
LAQINPKQKRRVTMLSHTLARLKKRKSLITLITLACGLFISGGGQRAAAQTTYRITDLGLLPGGFSSAAYAVNDAGVVVGRADTVVNGVQVNHAFIFDGQLRDIDQFNSPLSEPLAINNSGQVVGFYSPDLNLFRPFLYSAGMTDLTAFEGSAQATGINNLGHIVGWRNGITTAYFYNGLNTIVIPRNVDWTPFTPTALNDLDQIVGSAFSFTDNGVRAFLLNGASVVNLGTLPGFSSSAATDINNLGQIVGGADNNAGDSRAFIYDHGQLIDLGARLANIGQLSSSAASINDQGQVVGRILVSIVDGRRDFRAFLYDGTTAFDLNDLLPPNSGWRLTEARGINNEGQIVGIGTLNGSDFARAFLLTPVGDAIAPTLLLPAPIDVDATGTAGAQVVYTVSATDNYDPAPRISCDPPSGSIFAIGTTTVNCTAVDASGNSTSGTFTITVRGASTQLEGLIDLIDNTLTVDTQQGIASSFDAKLQRALDALAAAKANSTTSACSSLSGFINEVQAQSGKSITTTQANQLIAAARQIQAALGCQ